MRECRTLAREGKIKAGARRRKSGLHSEGRQVPRRKGRATKESLSKGNRRKPELVRERKYFPGRSGESEV